MMLPFLWPPRDVFVTAVATDLARARMTTIPDVTRSLFVHTIFYYSHREAMPGYATLVTFRDKSADEILGYYKRHSFFHHGKRLGYGFLWCLWLVLISIFAVVTKKRSREMAVVAYAATLMLAGLTIMLANGLLAEFQPRYTLPMWELTIISMTVAFGRGMGRWLHPGRKPPTADSDAGDQEHLRSRIN
jgi:putative flippase GtrA